MKNFLKTISALMLVTVLFAVCTCGVSAANIDTGILMTEVETEKGFTSYNPIILTDGVYNTKVWTKENCQENCFNQITLHEKGYITLTIDKALGKDGSALRSFFYLYDVDGNSIWTAYTTCQENSINKAYVYKIGLDKGTYLFNLDFGVYISSPADSFETKYKYEFTKDNYWEIENNNSMETATPIVLDAMYNGVYKDESYKTGYKDYFSVNLTANTHYRLKIDNFAELKTGTFVWDVRDPDDKSIQLKLSPEKWSGTTSYWDFLALKTGKYYIKFSNDRDDVGTPYKIGVYKLNHAIGKGVITPATLKSNGSITYKCTMCDMVMKSTKIYKPAKFSLSTTEYTYNGKVKTPSVTVKDSRGNTLKKGTDYEVKYEAGRKAVGQYTVTIAFKGKYSGTKNLYFTIAPKAPSKITASQTASTITLKWNKVTGADGYRIYKYNTKTKKYDKLKDVTGTSYKISKLKAGTSYKYKVRAYAKDNGIIWGEYSAVFTTATKPATPTLKVASTKKGMAALTWTNVAGENGYEVQYSSKKSSDYKKVASYKANVKKGSKSKLKSNKTYYFKVRAYKTVDGKKIYSSWSSVKSIKIK